MAQAVPRWWRLVRLSRLGIGGPVARLAVALGAELTELLPTTDPPDPVEVLRTQAQRLFDGLLTSADRETLQVLVPFLARLGESSAPSGR